MVVWPSDTSFFGTRLMIGFGGLSLYHYQCTGVSDLGSITCIWLWLTPYQGCTLPNSYFGHTGNYDLTFHIRYHSLPHQPLPAIFGSIWVEPHMIWKYPVWIYVVHCQGLTLHIFCNHTNCCGQYDCIVPLNSAKNYFHCHGWPLLCQHTLKWSILDRYHILTSHCW